ncbi:MAG: hypothetical protein KDK36_00270 [Leptospiraceae bacterium]|nr:hypothetical protein [Leptospiraceae bacterium]
MKNNIMRFLKTLILLFFFSCNLHQETGILPELMMLLQGTKIFISYPSNTISYTKYLAATTTPTITGTVTSCPLVQLFQPDLVLIIAV